MISCIGMLIATLNPYTIETCWASKQEIILSGRIDVDYDNYRYHGTFNGEIRFDDSCKVTKYRVMLNPRDMWMSTFIHGIGAAEIKQRAEAICKDLPS